MVEPIYCYNVHYGYTTNMIVYNYFGFFKVLFFVLCYKIVIKKNCNRKVEGSFVYKD